MKFSSDLSLNCTHIRRIFYYNFFSNDFWKSCAQCSNLDEYCNSFYLFQAIQALGSAIYKALDFGLSATEEPHLSPDLEEVIDFMTNPEEDDEGIDQCIFQDIIDVSFWVNCLIFRNFNQKLQISLSATFSSGSLNWVKVGLCWTRI